MARRTVLIAALIVVALTPAGANGPGFVLAQGEVDVFHDYCDAVGRGEISLILEPDSPNSPTDRWLVQLAGQTTVGCSVHAAALCSGAGTLADVITLFDCAPAASGGSFGPITVCIPGPARQFEPFVMGRATVRVDGVMGSFQGDVPATFAGTAAEEAARNNICV